LIRTFRFIVFCIWVADTDGGLLRDSWPNGSGRVPDSDQPEDEVMMDWQVVPDTYQEICDWAVVGSKHPSDSGDRARNKVLLYRELDQGEAGLMHGVTLRLQGFVKSCDLRPLGNWDGSASSLKYETVSDFCYTTREQASAVLSGRSTSVVIVWGIHTSVDADAAHHRKHQAAGVRLH
jgi:hypothetical protein